MKNNYSIVLVHIGDKFYNYINICIEQIRRFNNCEIYLVLPKKFKGLIKHDINIIPIETLEMTDKHLKFIQTTRLNTKFRGGFWKYAVERFFFIEDLIQTFNLVNVFHLENDVLIYRDLSEIVSVFCDNHFEMAATFDNDIRCIPGFLYFKDNNIISELNQFILSNNGVNDMEVIAEFNRVYDKIEFLPVIPENYDKEMKSISGLTTKMREKYFHNINIFNSIFDAAAIGQYLGGVDSRNQGDIKISIIKSILKWSEKLNIPLGLKPSLDTTGFINESSVFNVSDFNFDWNLDTKGRKIPYLLYKDKKYQINNLHIHSKNLKRFQ